MVSRSLLPLGSPANRSKGAVEGIDLATECNVGFLAACRMSSALNGDIILGGANLDIDHQIRLLDYGAQRGYGGAQEEEQRVLWNCMVGDFTVECSNRQL